jgi:hypothetical protein
MLMRSDSSPPPAGGGSGNIPARRAGVFGGHEWLSFAAAPTFAGMALLTAFGGPADMLCSAMGGGSFLSGMVPMYLLMSLFHLMPWLRLASSRGTGSGV